MNHHDAIYDIIGKEIQSDPSAENMSSVGQLGCRILMAVCSVSTGKKEDAISMLDEIVVEMKRTMNDVFDDIGDNDGNG